MTAENHQRNDGIDAAQAAEQQPIPQNGAYPPPSQMPPQPVPGMCQPPMQQPMPPQPPMCPPPMPPQPPRKDGRGFAIAAFVISIIALLIAFASAIIGLIGVGLGAYSATSTCETSIRSDDPSSSSNYGSDDYGDTFGPHAMSLHA